MATEETQKGEGEGGLGDRSSLEGARFLAASQAHLWGYHGRRESIMNLTGEEMDPRTHAIIGAAIEVHRRLGHGFLEAVYQEALAVELALAGIPFQREVELPVYYRGDRLRCAYKADFVCYGDIVVELKAIGLMTAVDQAQVMNYLRATGYRLGLLLNFGSLRLQVKRVRFDPELAGRSASGSR